MSSPMSYSPEEINRIHVCGAERGNQPDSRVAEVAENALLRQNLTIEDKASYTVADIRNAGYMLEPIRCLHCGEVGNVSYLQYIGDGLCESCGEWQLGGD